MIVIGVDPGGTTGLARVEADGSVTATTAANMDEIRHFLDDTLQRVLNKGLQRIDCHVVIEDFIGAGPRNADAINALKLVGFSEGYSRALGFDTTVQAPQTRKAYVGQAREMLSDASIHSVDALAHALSFMDKETRNG